MKKVTCLLAIAAAVALAPPVMAQSSDGTIAVGNPQASQPQVPQPPDGNVNWKGVGIGAGTVAGNVLYVPAKMVYGILGGLTGGASYLLTGGNTETANTIWRSSLGGDYVLTPDMIAGQKPVHFSGPTTTPAEPAQSTSIAAPAAGSPSMNSAPAQSAPARTASAANASTGISSSPIPGDSRTTGSATTGSAVPQPADRGTGPVSTGRSSNGGGTVPPLPSTSIE
jgi:hypothetical protein